MRILTVGTLYPPYHLGGYELVWQAAVRALRAAGHDVRVLATSDRLGRGDLPEVDPDVHRELRWYWHDHEFPPLSRLEAWRLDRGNRATLRAHLSALRPDAVSWWALGGTSMSLLRVPRVPAIGWVNDDWMRYGPKVDQWARRVSLDRAARWVFCSELTRRSALEVHPGLADTAVRYQGVAPEFAAAPEADWQGRLLYVGRLDERKGLRTLADAVSGLPDMTLRVVGDGDESLRSLASPRVVFEPGVDRAALPAVYAAADAVVFPVEWYEPWGLVPLEAMAVGRPVVATGRGGSGEYLRDGVNCLRFEPGDAESLRGALRRLRDDPALRARLRAGGFETATRLTEAAWTAAVVAEHEALARP
jgi:glycosyltransferase involved in cell wall biosynthesis